MRCEHVMQERRLIVYDSILQATKADNTYSELLASRVGQAKRLLIDSSDQSSTDMHAGPEAQVEVLMKDSCLGQTANEHQDGDGVSTIKWLRIIGPVALNKTQYFAQKHGLQKP